MSQPPLLRITPLTREPVVILRYQRKGGAVRASDKREIDPREVLILLDDLGVSDETLDEVGNLLGMVRDKEPRA